MKKIKYLIYIIFLIAAFSGIYLVVNYSKEIPPNLILHEPENNAYLNSRNVHFSWDVIYDKNVDFLKSLYIGNATPSELIYEGLENSFEIDNLKPGEYYWKVILKYGKKIIESPVYTFSIVNNPPQVPVLELPKNESKILDKRVTFSWKTSDPDGDTLRYDLYFDKYQEPKLFVANLSNSTFTISDLAPGIYYWKVLAKDSYGAISESEVFSFEVASEGPKKPVIEIRKVGNYLRVYWEKKENLKYTLEIDEEGKLKTVQVDNSYYDIKIKPGVKYKFRLKVEDRYGQVAYSEFKEFRVINNPPEYVIYFPPNNLKGVTNKIVFKWELFDPEDEPTVDFYFGESPENLKLIVGNYKGKIFEMGGLKPNTKYYWKIKVSDPYVSIDSPVYEFSTGPKLEIKNVFGTNLDDQVNDFIKYNNYYVILGTQNEKYPFLLKLEGNKKEIVNINVEGNGVKLLNKGEIIYVLGNLNREHGDIFLAAVKDWKVSWMKTYGGTFKDVASDMLIEDDGILILGYSWSSNFVGKLYGWCDIFLMKVDFSGNILWIKKFGGSQYDESVKLLKLNDNYVIAANTTSRDLDVPRNYGLNDIWVFSVNRDGKFKWLRVFGTEDSDIVTNMKIYDNKIYVLGRTYRGKNGEISENSNIWLIILDENGNKIKEYVFSGNGNDIANDLLISGNYFWIFGRTNSTSGDFYANYYFKKGFYDFFITKVVNGTFIWSRVTGGYGYDEIKKALVDGDKIVFVGNTTSTDGEFEFNNGSTDIFMGIMEIER
ncbi:fibronectin type III domain-containing protein [Thermosipho atlanticus]|uniref:Fibronectin type III domain-containing protein n=1 Tax=Thermosipho atlanticus DSM 15807 TaxID=1123380 RepID=A0A1M5S0Z2_9BACT|nr:hypothetical protein [Thermosipho atlanticus]SHH32109.1 hypothetical protein SAMN02745199_0736 [Thermosipho atlanticus DSM 15807]